MREERRAPRDDFDGDLSERVEEPVRAGAQQPAKLTVAEVKAHLEAADLVPLEKEHGDTSRPPDDARRASLMGHACEKGLIKGTLRCKTPLGNGSSGGHALRRGAALLPTRPMESGPRPAGTHMRPKPHDMRHVCVPIAVGEGRRNPRASGRPFALHSPGFRAATRRFSPDEGRPTRPPVPLGPIGRDVSSVPEQSVLSRPRRVVDGSRTRDTQVMSLVL